MDNFDVNSLIYDAVRTGDIDELRRLFKDHPEAFVTPVRKPSWVHHAASDGHTIFDNGDPPAPLAPNVRFNAILARLDGQMTAKDGRTINLYRLIPIYPEERNLARRGSIDALLEAMDRAGIPRIVDLSRPNFAT